MYAYACVFDIWNTQFGIWKSLLSSIVSCCGVENQQWFLLPGNTPVSSNLPISILCSLSLSMLWEECSSLCFFGTLQSHTYGIVHICGTGLWYIINFAHCPPIQFIFVQMKEFHFYSRILVHYAYVSIHPSTFQQTDAIAIIKLVCRCLFGVSYS